MFFKTPNTSDEFFCFLSDTTVHNNTDIIVTIQVILAGTLTGVQGDTRCKVLAALSTVK